MMLEKVPAHTHGKTYVKNALMIGAFPPPPVQSSQTRSDCFYSSKAIYISCICSHYARVEPGNRSKLGFQELACGFGHARVRLVVLVVCYTAGGIFDVLHKQYIIISNIG